MTDVNEILEKIDQALNAEAAHLSSEERDEIREILRAWQLWKSMGVIGKIIIWCLMTLAGMVVAWQQVKAGFVKWTG